MPDFIPPEARGFKALRDDGTSITWYHVYPHGIRVAFRKSPKSKIQYKTVKTEQEAEAAMDKFMENY